MERTEAEIILTSLEEFIKNNPTRLEWLQCLPEDKAMVTSAIENKKFVNTEPEVFQMKLRLLITSFWLQQAIELHCKGRPRWPQNDITGRLILAYNLLVSEAEQISESGAGKDQANPLFRPEELARRLGCPLDSKAISLTYSELLQRIKDQCNHPECIEIAIRHILDTNPSDLYLIYCDVWKFLPNYQWGTDCEDARIGYLGPDGIGGIEIESPRDETGIWAPCLSNFVGTPALPGALPGTKVIPRGSPELECLGRFLVEVDGLPPLDTVRQQLSASITEAASAPRGEDPTGQHPNGTTNTTADSTSRARDSIELARDRLGFVSPAAQNDDPFGEDAPSAEESDTEDLFGDEASLASNRTSAGTGAVFAHASTTSQPQKSVGTANTEPEPLDDTPEDAPKDDGSSSKRRHSATSDSPQPDETHSLAATPSTATHAMAQVTKRRKRTARKSAGGKAPRPQLASQANRGLGSWWTQSSIHFSVPVDRLVEEFQAGRDVVLDPSGLIIARPRNNPP